MMRKFTLLFLLATTTSLVQAQLVIDVTPPNNNAAHLVQNVLLGTGVTVSNITFSGAPSAIGFFDGTNSNIGLDSGLVIATGDVTNAVGPNNLGSTTTSFNNPGNALLDQLTTSSTNDAAILEFDFIPSADTVKFGFVFASEEYPEFVGSTFNDVFGFFISGPIPGGGTYNNQNIALIPGTSTSIAINNVNQNSNNQFYIDNTGGTTVDYDGFTTRLEAVANVICNQQYHLTIGIADAGDYSYDSGVFLEAASLSSTGATVTSVVSSSVYAINDSTLYEGCGTAELRIKLSDIAESDSVIYYTIGGTAINGVDYALIADSVIVPTGSDSASIFIQPIFDGLSENDETVILNFPFANFCLNTQPVQSTIYIVNVDSLELTYKPDDQILCDPEGFYLYLQAQGGVPPIEFDWAWGDTTATGYDLYHTPLTSTTYYITVTDACLNQTIEDSITITVLDNDDLAVQGSANPSELCVGDSVFFSGLISGGAGTASVQWLNEFGIPLSNSANFAWSQFNEADGTTQTFQLLAVDECDNRDSVEVTIELVDCQIEIPNVFTPNGDGTHEGFYINNLSNYDNAQLSIYNRWGAKVFESLNYGAACDQIDAGGCWNGKVNNTGADCPEGTYFYILNVPNQTVTPSPIHGSLMLFR